MSRRKAPSKRRYKARCSTPFRPTQFSKLKSKLFWNHFVATGGRSITFRIGWNKFRGSNG